MSTCRKLTLNATHCARVGLCRPRRLNRRSLAVFAEPPPKQKIDVEKAVKDAQEACEDGTAAECATAWDTVEELSAAKAKKKEATVVDPLEQYCEEEPDADECRVYED